MTSKTKSKYRSIHITSHMLTLHYIAFHFRKYLHLHYCTFLHNTSRCTAIQHMKLHFIQLQIIRLRDITFKYSTLMCSCMSAFAHRASCTCPFASKRSCQITNYRIHYTH